MRPKEQLNATDSGCTRMEYETFFVVSPCAGPAAVLRDKKFPDLEYARQTAEELCSGRVCSIPDFILIARTLPQEWSVVRIYIKQ